MRTAAYEVDVAMRPPQPRFGASVRQDAHFFKSVRFHTDSAVKHRTDFRRSISL